MKVKIVVALLVLTVIAGFVLDAANIGTPVSATTRTVERKPTRTPKPVNSVTLSKPDNQDVQMWANPGSGGDASAYFPSGTPCTKTGRLYTHSLGDGITSDYYKLTCKGITGYVNIKWVD